METIIYNDKEVRIKTKDVWFYLDADNYAIKTLNSTLHDEIQKEVNYYCDNQEQIEKEKQEKEDLERLKLRTEQVEIFKQRIEKEFGELLKDYDISYRNPSGDRWHFNPNKLTIYDSTLKQNISIEYEDGMWELFDFDYKKRRYKKLENAINKVLYFIEERKERLIREKEEEQNKNIAKDRMKRFAENNGFKFDEVFKRNKYNKQSYYYLYYMIRENLKVQIKYNDETEQIEILNYKVTSKNITMDDINNIL